ncbi:hypothetical protein [Spirosoma validum]|uniref:Uncharacterized protein n=1 Tax=Spirosoma validum TaxID=2771355 RepID=A0A927B4U8_9BACT|nr:hypothetical protein [Spirosoma validum]MBD2755267.1 hypothetical protein [Spirosoma validum]
MKVKVLFLASLSTGLFFLLFFLNAYIFRIDHVLINFIQEIATLPMLLIQLVLLYFTVRKILTQSSAGSAYVTGSLLILLGCILATFGSIVYALWEK